MFDVIIIGGSHSGLAAALQLARARRTVLIIDAVSGGTGRARAPTAAAPASNPATDPECARMPTS